MEKSVLKLFALSAIVCGISLSSCQKKDVATNAFTPSNDPIAGKWMLEQTEYRYQNDGRIYNDTVQYRNEEYIQFNNDGTLVTNTDSLTEGLWKQENSHLILYERGDSSVFDVQGLTSSSMVLFIRDTDPDGYSESTWRLKK